MRSVLKVHSDCAGLNYFGDVGADLRGCSPYPASMSAVTGTFAERTILAVAATTSAQERIFDLNGAVNSASKNHSSATIVVDDRQSCYRINSDGVFGTHTGLELLRLRRGRLDAAAPPSVGPAPPRIPCSA